VDIHGYDVPTGEKDLPPHDPTDASQWPAWTDNWYWEVSDDERAALEAAAIAEECDRRDAVDPVPGDRWITLMTEASPPAISGGALEPYEPSPEDWEEYNRWSEDRDRQRCAADAVRRWYDRNPSFGDWLESQGGPRS
jgi:hypothetical protein